MHHVIDSNLYIISVYKTCKMNDLFNSTTAEADKKKRRSVQTRVG